MRKSTAQALSILVAVLFLFPYSGNADSIYSGCDNSTTSGTSAGSFGYCDVGKPDVARTLVNLIVDVNTPPGAGNVYFKIETNTSQTIVSCRNVTISSAGLTVIPLPASVVPAGLGINATYFSDAACTVGGTGLVMDGPPYVVFTWSNNLPIDFTNISLPNIYGTSSTSTVSRGLFRSMDFASSTANCASQGNIFSEGICTAFTFIFVPDPQILNQYVALTSTTSSSSIAYRFPFSWIYGFQGAAAALESATSSGNMMTLSLNLTGKMASSTGSHFNPDYILPNIVLLSKDTIVGPYMTQAQWNILQALIAAAIWLAFFWDVYSFVRHRSHRV